VKWKFLGNIFIKFNCHFENEVVSPHEKLLHHQLSSCWLLLQQVEWFSKGIAASLKTNEETESEDYFFLQHSFPTEKLITLRNAAVSFRNALVKSSSYKTEDLAQWEFRDGEYRRKSGRCWMGSDCYIYLLRCSNRRCF
jgi:hypothetical protein